MAVDEQKISIVMRNIIFRNIRDQNKNGRRTFFE